MDPLSIILWALALLVVVVVALLLLLITIGVVAAFKKPKSKVGQAHLQIYKGRGDR